MTLEEKIKAFAVNRDNKMKADQEAEDRKRNELIERIRPMEERIRYLLKLAMICRTNRVPIGYEQDILKSDGIKTNCFITNGWSHRIGFTDDLRYIGYIHGGACGRYDFRTNGHNVESVHEDTGVISKPIIEHMEKFLREFDEFEHAFLQYIDKLI